MQQATKNDRLAYSVRDAVAATSLSRPRIYQLIKAGELEPGRSGVAPLSRQKACADLSKKAARR